MSLVYPFTIPANSSSWFRFLLPRSLMTQDRKEVSTGIAEWEGVQVSLELVDGTHVDQSG
jgi:hypothetical protein